MTDPDERRIREHGAHKANDEIAVINGSIDALNSSMKSQIMPIRKFIRSLSDGDTTLRERKATLFLEQGVTNVSILTAISMTISTIVLAIVSGKKYLFTRAQTTPRTTPRTKARP